MPQKNQKNQKQQPYWQRKQESFANVNTGFMITCIACNVNCYQNRFSKVQMDKYRASLASERRGGPKAELPRCIPCTPQAVKELFCTGCRLTKDLDQFSGRHRKNPDNAKCIDCQQEIDDRVPTLEAALDEERIRDEQRQRMGPSSILTSSAGSVSGPRSQSQTQSASASEIYVADERDSAWGGGQVSARPPSPTNTEISVSRTTSSYSGGASRNTFAKQHAYTAPPERKVANQLEREERQKQQAQMASKQDDSDGEQSDWEL